jgi:hypothetical protein
MNVPGDTVGYGAAIVCAYAAHEFVLARVVLKPSRTPGDGGRTAVKRGALLLVTMLVGTSGFLSPALGVGYVVVAAVSVIYDLLTTRGTPQSLLRRSLELFIARQLLMIILLCAAGHYAMPLRTHDWWVTAENAVAGNHVVALREHYTLMLAIAASYLFVIDGGTRIVKGILGKFPGLYMKVIQTLNADGAAASPPTENEENVGEWIGILERIITLTLVLTGNLGAIAFVLTAKSIARFKALENKDFAEYYLLGTSGSIIAALSAGLIVRLMFGL